MATIGAPQALQNVASAGFCLPHVEHAITVEAYERRADIPSPCAVSGERSILEGALIGRVLLLRALDRVESWRLERVLDLPGSSGIRSCACASARRVPWENGRTPVGKAWVVGRSPGPMRARDSLEYSIFGSTVRVGPSRSKMLAPSTREGRMSSSSQTGFASQRADSTPCSAPAIEKQGVAKPISASSLEGAGRVARSRFSDGDWFLIP